MKIDLHTHAKWSKGTDFSYGYYRSMMQAAGQAGLDAIALTEHFDTRGFHEMFRTLDRHCSSKQDYYWIEGVKVFPGIEVDVAEGGHILLIGTRAAITEIRCQLEPWIEPDAYIGLSRLLDLADAHDCLKIGAHPYREKNPLHHVQPELLARLDALDLNGRDLHHIGRHMTQRVTELAEKIGLPVVAGSDTHLPPQFGCVCNQLAVGCVPPETVKQLRTLIRQGAYAYSESLELDLLVCEAEQLQLRYKSNMKQLNTVFPV